MAWRAPVFPLDSLVQVEPSWCSRSNVFGVLIERRPGSRVTLRNFGSLSIFIGWPLYFRLSWFGLHWLLFEKTVQTVLFVLSLVRHVFIQISIWLSIRWSCLFMNFVSLLLAQAEKSSANMPMSTPLTWISVISLKKRLNSTGPRILPWGTPASITFVEERKEPTRTWDVRFER